MEMREGRSYFETRFFQSGKTRRLSFQTRSKEDAAKQAADVWKDIERRGWDDAFNKVRPPVEAQAGTVGALIKAATSLSMARPSTLHTYALALRGIAAGVTGRKESDNVRLDALTPSAVKVWRNTYVKERDTNPVKRGQAIVTTNSLIRNAKALFAKKHLEDLRILVNLPQVLPFDGVRLEVAPSGRYQSRIDAIALTKEAKEGLAVQHPEVFKLFVLTMALGLRRSEADRLTWEAFDFKNRKLNLSVSEDGDLKSADSAGVIDFDEGTAVVLQEYRAKTQSRFVLEADPVKAGRKKRKREPYRAERTGRQLLLWLREQGVTGTKLIHTLRKEVGSVIATEHGLLAAQRFLRHSTPTITAAIYADVKKVVVPGFGRFLVDAAPV
jgi:integrase